ncbi:MAG: formate dehydrogenase subunit gamma, partial [Alphaproteobacteria bacterium]
ILALTGLNITYGKYVLMPLIGKGAFATLSAAGKWLHNYVAFAFTVGLVMIFVLWVKDNIPNRYDLTWLAKGGGLFVKGVHPPSKKFNAGQKLIFWSVVLGGTSLILSGISLLFPFQFAMFAKTFAILNIFGFDLPTQLTPIQEMQYATLWHAIVAIGLICIIIAHIYIGTIGMEGAFDAMGSGEVDINWAKEHHSIWAEEVLAASAAPKRKGKRKGGSAAAPAE